MVTVTVHNYSKEETIQGRKLYEEIRYMNFEFISKSIFDISLQIFLYHRATKEGTIAICCALPDHFACLLSEQACTDFICRSSWTLIWCVISYVHDQYLVSIALAVPLGIYHCIGRILWYPLTHCAK